MRINLKNLAFAGLALLSSVFMIGTASAANPPTNADQLVAQHLDSIATPAIRAGLKTRVAQSPVRYTILVGGAGVIEGKAVLVSDGKKLRFMVKLPNNTYKGELFVFDGDKDKVAFSTAAQTRSPFGNFVFVQDAVIREGLMGGVLSTAWPLLNLDERKAKLNFDGLKKIDGQELYDLHYRPKKGTDLEIHLYFDPQTYRHVQTTYTYSVSQRFVGGGASTLTGLPSSPGAGDGPGTGGTQGSSPDAVNARQQLSRYRLQERFSDFKTVDGVTLPTHYDIQFTQEPQTGTTTLTEWDLKGIDVTSNVTVDPQNFDVK